MSILQTWNENLLATLKIGAVQPSACRAPLSMLPLLLFACSFSPLLLLHLSSQLWLPAGPPDSPVDREQLRRRHAGGPEAPHPRSHTPQSDHPAAGQQVGGTLQLQQHIWTCVPLRPRGRTKGLLSFTTWQPVISKGILPQTCSCRNLHLRANKY